MGTFKGSTFLLCTSFIPFILHWEELDLGHNTFDRNMWTHGRIRDGVRIYGKVGCGARKQYHGECSNSEG